MATATLTPSDIQIQRDVLSQLKWEPQVRPNEIGVTVEGGVVTLRGSVDSNAKRLAAEETAHRVRGVRAVANDIDVSVAELNQRTDQDIAAAAVQALGWDVTIPAENIRVTVSRGWVKLEGEVEWQFQREHAESDVCRLTGVTGVSNLLAITSRPAAQDVERAIRDAILRTARGEAERISADVTPSGKVILYGSVHHWADREEAQRQAWAAPGVTSVENLISIAPA